jgi:hypothetical protein
MLFLKSNLMPKEPTKNTMYKVDTQFNVILSKSHPKELALGMAATSRPKAAIAGICLQERVCLELKCEYDLYQNIY